MFSSHMKNGTERECISLILFLLAYPGHALSDCVETFEEFVLVRSSKGHIVHLVHSKHFFSKK